jgi:hypothetical protein
MSIAPEKKFTASEAALQQARTRFPRVLVDESHRQAWSIRHEVAEQMNPRQPEDASLVRAADHMRSLGFHLTAHDGSNGPLSQQALADADVLLVPHFSDPRFERTIDMGSHLLDAAEIDGIVEFVSGGGGLVVLAEHEHDKYGTNLNSLLERFGLSIDHQSIIDPDNSHNKVAAWIHPVFDRPGRGLLAQVENAVLYRAGVVTIAADVSARVVARSSAAADPAHAPTIVAVEHGRGRVVVVTDSDLFGDDSLDDGDHLQLFANLMTWAASAPRERDTTTLEELPLAWLTLKNGVNELRKMQSADGSIDLNTHDLQAVKELSSRVSSAYLDVAALHPHDAAFHSAALADFDAWIASGFGVPDFLDSLMLFQPEQMRRDGLEHVVLLPMYTQNGNPDRVFEAIWIRTVWPSWIAELEASGYDNPAFVPIEFVDFTDGYETHSAVFFPETVAVRTTPKFHWGGIFCDREAARFREVVKASAELLHIDLPPAAELLLNDPSLTKETYVLWDLVHDRTHSHGELPFDPFMIKQRIPYWMYSLEEMRCDLNAYREMDGLAAAGIPHAPLVKYGILFDRLLRFPISGDRTKNYDGLVGQIFFAHLHRSGVLKWADNTLSIDWNRVDGAMDELAEQVNGLYRSGIDRSRVAFWLAAHELVSTLVPAHPSSKWSAGLDFQLPPRELVDAVLPDEFPLNVFYEALAKKLAPVIEAIRGARL